MQQTQGHDPVWMLAEHLGGQEGGDISVRLAWDRGRVVQMEPADVRAVTLDGPLHFAVGEGFASQLLQLGGQSLENLASFLQHEDPATASIQLLWLLEQQMYARPAESIYM